MAPQARAAALCAVALAAFVLVVHAEPAAWSAYKEGVQAMRVGASTATVGEMLGPVMEWDFDGNLDTIRRGQAFTGPNNRLRRVLADMLNGKPVEVAVLGGSISTGAVASRKMAAVDPNDCWSMVRLWMQQVNPAVEFYNNARSACKSYIYSQCLPKFLNSTADLVFLEFVANDGSEMDVTLTANEKTRSFERLLRKVLSQPSAPAVVMLQMMVEGQAYEEEGRNGKPKQEYFETPEDLYYNLAQYYGVPTLSYRDAVFYLAEFGREGASWDTFQGPDRLHPNDLGHKVMADMVIYLMQQTSINLVTQPVGLLDVQSATQPLPPPMYQGNEIGDPTKAQCIQGQALETIAVGTDGWELKPGGNPRYPTYGYETTQKDKPLVFEVDTRMPDGRLAGVNLYFSESNEGIGNYQFSCSNGCTCDQQVINGQLTYAQTVTFMNTIHPTGAAKCHVNVELADDSSTGSKLRVTGLTLTGDPGSFENARIGEETYMAWLSGTDWAS